VSEVVGELYVARERERERLVEVEYFEQLVPLDHVQVAVSQRAHVGCRLYNSRLLPELVAKHVAFTFHHTTYCLLLLFLFIIIIQRL